MRKQIKRILKAVLFRLPGGKRFYTRVYLPWALRSQSSEQPMPSSISTIPKSPDYMTLDFYRGVLEQDLTLQEEWTLLLREVVSHLKFLNNFLKPATEQEARQLLEEFYRHQGTMIHMFEALLARQESQITWLRTLLAGPYPVDADRIRRLEKVIEYLIEITGEPHARRPHWEH